jgi:hypothetical protein
MADAAIRSRHHVVIKDKFILRWRSKRESSDILPQKTAADEAPMHVHPHEPTLVPQSIANK